MPTFAKENCCGFIVKFMVFFLNWPLQHFSRNCNLASHTTYEWAYCLPNASFLKLFKAIFICSQSFYQKTAERKLLKEIFVHIFFEILKLGLEQIDRTPLCYDDLEFFCFALLFGFNLK